MTEKKKLSRREFFKAVGFTVGGAGLISLSGWKLAEALGLRPEKFTERLAEQLDWYWREIRSYIDGGGTQVALETKEPTAQPIKTQKASILLQPEKTPTLKPDVESEAMKELAPVEKEKENEFKFAEIDFSDPTIPIEMMITTVENNKILIPEFNSYSWSPKVDEENIFNPDNNTGVAWQDDGKRIGLWLHSGRAGPLHEGYTMWETQKFIEEDENGNRIPYWVINELLDKIIKGADITIKQGKKSVNAKITAAVRIPPSGVIKSTKHFLDMVPYLAKNYPEKGFEELVDKKQVLLPKFCGRLAAGEKENKELPYYQQARFVFGIEKA